jgi:hypothetical protein
MKARPGLRAFIVHQVFLANKTCMTTAAAGAVSRLW